MIIALDAGGVAAEAVQFFAPLDFHHGGSEERVDLGMSGVDLIAKLLMPHGEHGTLPGEGAMETPLAVGESLYEMPFGGTLRKPFLEKLLAMGLVGLHVLLRRTTTWPVRPCRVALRLERFLPAGVRGPVLCFALARLVSI